MTPIVVTDKGWRIMSKFLCMVTHDDGCNGSKATGALLEVPYDVVHDSKYIMAYPFGWHHISDHKARWFVHWQ
jgi:hypothetical protein